MRSLISTAAATLLACSGGTEKVTGSVGVSSPVEVSSISAPVSLASPVAVSRVADPVAVSTIDAPVTVASIATPVTVAGIEAPVVVQAARPELDPERIETGTALSGVPVTCYPGSSCRMLVQGPFVLSDVILTALSRDDASGARYVKLFVAADPGSATRRWEMSVPADDLESGTTTSLGGSSTTYTGRSTHQHAITGARLSVRAGENLYLDVTQAGTGGVGVTWSGFRP